MAFTTTLFKVDVCTTEQDREYWVTRPWVSGALASKIRSADVLIAPLVNFREEHEILFPNGTTDFLRALGQEIPGQIVTIAIDQEHYEEIALHARQVRWPTVLVTSILLPLLVNALTEVAKKFLMDDHAQGSAIEMTVIVEGTRGHCIEIKYNGPATDLAKTLLEQSERCLTRMEKSDKPLVQSSKRHQKDLR